MPLKRVSKDMLDKNSAPAPLEEQNREIGAIDGPAAIKVDGVGDRSPGVEEKRQIRSIDDAITVEVT